MSAEETDLRKDLEAAFEQHTEAPAQEENRSAADSQESVRDSQTSEGQEAISGEEDANGGGRERDEGGRFKAGDKSAEQQSKPAGPTQAAAKATQQTAPEQPSQAPPKEDLAVPVGWKPGARQEWAKIPRAAQEEIVRREKEAAQTLRQSSQARQFANEFQQTINPFMPLIQAQNSNPMQAVKNLMTTAAGLTVGTAVQKAQIVREIIQNYGVDIQTLDQVLSGQPIQQQGNVQQSHMAPPPWATPLFQFMNTVQQSRQQREQQLVQDAEAETDAFAAKNEFFEDVREDMADLMQVAAQRGVIMSMDEAYKRAISLNPEISTIVSQREAAKRAQSSNIQRNRNAASSIHGAPRNGPTGAKSGEDSRRAALEEAWDAQSGR